MRAAHWGETSIVQKLLAAGAVLMYKIIWEKPHWILQTIAGKLKLLKS